MFNKERFHNVLALSLGYERIVKDNRISISVEEKSEDPWVTIKIQGSSEVLRMKASDSTINWEFIDIPAIQDEMEKYIDAVHQAYIQATMDSF